MNFGEEVSVNFVLSKREEEVINLIIKGLTNKQIANQLFITESTVKSYISNILLKTHLKNRYEIIIYFTQHDIKRYTKEGKSKIL